MVVIRSEWEIELLRTANQIVAEVLATLAEHIRPGITTKDLDKIAEEMIRERGAIPSFKGYRGYPAATCISIEDEVVHGIPSKRALKEGEIVSIDVGTCYCGYYGDAAVTLPCGDIDAQRKKLIETTDLALSKAICIAKEGNTINDIGKIIEDTCKKEGFSVVRDFVGHGIGTEMHEPLQIPNFDTGKPGVRLRKGMILAIEPMVNMGTSAIRILNDGWTAVTRDGLPSAHFEHSIVVREDKGEILSYSEKLIWGQQNN